MKRTLWYGVLVVLVLAIGTVSFAIATGDPENPAAGKDSLSEVSPAAPVAKIVSLTCYIDGVKHTTPAGDLFSSLSENVHIGDVILFSAKVRYDGPRSSRGTWWFINPTDTSPAWQGALLKPGRTKTVTIGRPYVVLSAVGTTKDFTILAEGPDHASMTSRIYHFVVVSG